MPHELRVQITQVGSGAGREQILVELPDYQVKCVSTLCFAEDAALSAVLKALNAVTREFDPRDFYADELAWLNGEALIAQKAERSYYSANLASQIGGMLFNCLFSNPTLLGVYQQVRRSSADSGIDLELRHSVEDALVGAQPWELMHDGTDFVCGGGRGTLARYLTFDAPPVAPSPPDGLRVLVITARPVMDLPPLPTSDLEAVRAGAGQAFAAIESLEPPTLESLQAYLGRNEVPLIIHFDGHGAFGRRCRACRQITQSKRAVRCANAGCGEPFVDERFQGYLAFEDAQRCAHFVSANELADLIREYPQAGSENSGVLLVVLSACRSAVARNGASVFNGVAQRLIDARVPAVVATQFTIETRAATRFVRTLYENIAAGQPLRRAVSRGQTTLGREGDQWYRPVLYLRWRDNAGGQLWLPPKAPAAVLVDETPASSAPAGRRKLNANQRGKLRHALLACGVMAGRESRRQIWSDMQADFSELRFKSNPDDAIEIAGMIDSCLAYSGMVCLEHLLEILEGYEGSHNDTMKAVWATWREVTA